MSFISQENIEPKTKCNDYYTILIEELKGLQRSDNTIQNNIGNNPFSDEVNNNNEPIKNVSDANDILSPIFGKYTSTEIKNFIVFLECIKADSLDFKTRFPIRTIDFLIFLKSFYEKTKNIENFYDRFSMLLDFVNDKKVALRLYKKYFRFIFLFQNIAKISFQEVSTLSKFYKLNFENDKFIESILEISIRSYIKKSHALYSGTQISQDTVYRFSHVFKLILNAINGAVSEIGFTEIDISKIIFIILVFYYEKGSIFLKHFTYKELFYCAIRSLNQGRTFAKKLEHFVFVKLRWQFWTDSYTFDNIYQNVFKSEFKKYIGSVKIRQTRIFKNINFIKSKVPDEDKTVLITKIVHMTTQKSINSSPYPVSPLSKRIGEANRNKESLDSKRMLKFD